MLDSDCDDIGGRRAIALGRGASFDLEGVVLGQTTHKKIDVSGEAHRSMLGSLLRTEDVDDGCREMAESSDTRRNHSKPLPGCGTAVSLINGLEFISVAISSLGTRLP
jgi:hypothetical protein